MKACTVSGCGRPSRARGLCIGHYKAQSEGRPLVPLREQAAEKRLVVSLRVSPPCRERVEADYEGARSALERWAKRRSGTSQP